MHFVYNISRLLGWFKYKKVNKRNVFLVSANYGLATGGILYAALIIIL